MTEAKLPEESEGVTKVAGVDGCRTGWVVARGRLGPRLVVDSVEAVPTFEAVVAVTEDCSAVAVDIPIGLETACSRTADGLARRLLGRRGSSVFPAPVRTAVEIAGRAKELGYADGAYRAAYRQACAASIEACGKSLSPYAFGISAKISEANEAMTPALQLRVVEAHPELAFSALNGRPLDNPKLSPAGKEERRDLLEAMFGINFGTIALPRGAAWDDMYDACVLVWTAARLIKGEAVRLPADAPLDDRGLRMEIVY
jgi:predicted RNase H-like nuclease